MNDMLTYISGWNWLSIYGAIIGTIALILSYYSNRRKLKVTSFVLKDAQLRLNALEQEHHDFYIKYTRYHLKSQKLRTNFNVGPIYKIVVSNIGNKEMHLKEAGLEYYIHNEKKQIKASQKGELNYTKIVLPPGSEIYFDINLDLDMTDPVIIPKILKCYVIDQTDKIQTGKHNENYALVPPKINHDM